MVDQAKVEQVGSIHEKFLKANGAVFADYRGMTVENITELRNQLREVSSELAVVKNTFAKIAAKETQFECGTDNFTGPTTIAYCYDDVVAPAKIITAFQKKNENLKVKGGVVEGSAVNAKEVAIIANLPAKEVLLSKMVGSMQSPISGFVGVLGGVLRELVYVLNAVKEKKGGN